MSLDAPQLSRGEGAHGLLAAVAEGLADLPSGGCGRGG